MPTAYIKKEKQAHNKTRMAKAITMNGEYKNKSTDQVVARKKQHKHKERKKICKKCINHQHSLVGFGIERKPSMLWCVAFRILSIKNYRERETMAFRNRCLLFAWTQFNEIFIETTTLTPGSEQIATALCGYKTISIQKRNSNNKKKIKNCLGKEFLYTKLNW